MALSQHAEKYLRGLRERIDKWRCEETIVLDYLDKQGFWNYNILYDFQTKYSGLELTIAGKSSESLLLRLFSKNDILKNRIIVPWSSNNDMWFSCAEHATAQYGFYINPEGKICCAENSSPNIICSSVDILIEQYALKNKLSSKYENENYYELKDSKKFKSFLQQYEFIVIKECTDKYSKWYTNEKVTIEQGTWFDNPEQYIHLYENNEKTGKQILDRMKDEEII